MAYYVYILTNKSNTLYVGVTNNIERRILEHKTKKAHFTNKYHIDRLIYFQEFTQIVDAIGAEKRIKGWTRKKKIALIKTVNPGFMNLMETDIKSEILRTSSSG